ncbi:hypothetical protein H8A97_16235 [Bradyrhizobium sp. Arg62]|uniref:hypothetical protein n=1 Tax=Bradyrhizobium brasilense TaxID=1419277 RepID=UPI001E5FD96F|nr:hypothetical protein [Bradyrhizobium brasilense]MCC8946617.1 hypothetical protein [Bradyrhizobium brasilense]
MSANIKQDHFYRAALEIGQSGENDTLPYDLDAQFVKDNAGSLATVCFDFFKSVEAKPKKQALDFISALNVGSERLLTATGSHGFRITTKIHPFWNLYLNGLGIGIAEANEARRSSRVHSYRLSRDQNSLFDSSKSWRAYKEARGVGTFEVNFGSRLRKMAIGC